MLDPFQPLTSSDRGSIITGWRVEIIKYCRRILCILHMMVEIQTDVLPENNVEVIEYMSQEDLVRVKTFIRLAHLELPGDDNLHELVEERMNESIKKWEEELAIGKYEIDSADSLTQLSGGHRIESVRCLFRNAFNPVLISVFISFSTFSLCFMCSSVTTSV
jgi:hypothetical protein